MKFKGRGYKRKSYQYINKRRKHVNGYKFGVQLMLYRKLKRIIKVPTLNEHDTTIKLYPGAWSNLNF